MESTMRGKEDEKTYESPREDIDSAISSMNNNHLKITYKYKSSTKGLLEPSLRMITIGSQKDSESMITTPIVDT